MHRTPAVILPDTRPTGYPVNLKAGYRISSSFFLLNSNYFVLYYKTTLKSILKTCDLFDYPIELNFNENGNSYRT